MAEIVPIETFGITEDGGGFLKGNAVLLQVGQRFPGSQENTFLYIH